MQAWRGEGGREGGRDGGMEGEREAWKEGWKEAGREAGFIKDSGRRCRTGVSELSWPTTVSKDNRPPP